MIYVERAGDVIKVSCSPRDRELMRSIPGALYNAAPDWTLPLGWGSCLALRSTFGAELEIGPDLTEWATQQRTVHGTLEAVKKGEATLPAGLHPDLFDYQADGVQFLIRSPHTVLADSMGVGKTVQMIDSLRVLQKVEGSLPALIVCTNSMKWKWAEEFGRWWPEARTQVVDGNAPQRTKQIMSGADVIIVNWDLLRRHSRLESYGSTELSDAEKVEGPLNAVGFKTVVADEAHKALSPKAKQTRALWYLMHRASYRYALTGTPVRNAPEDVWALGHAVAPYDFPRRSKFIERYTLNGSNGWGFEVFGWNQATKDEALAILDPHFLRRDIRDVLPGLPPRLPHDIRTVPLSPKQAKAYKEMKKHMFTMLESGVLLTGDPLVRLARLTQIADALPVLDSAGEVISLDMPSSKIEAMLDVIEEGGSDSLVVFASSRKLIELADRVLTEKKITHTMLTGKTPAAERALNVERFQAGEVQVFLGTSGAGGEGITLTKANRLLFLRRSFSLPENLQVEARIDRIGQERPPQIIDILSADTLDADVLETVFEKEGRLQEVCRDPNWLKRILT